MAGTASDCLSFVPDDVLSRLGRLSVSEADKLPFGVVKVDDKGTILMMNRYECELGGVKAAEVAGKIFFTQVAPCTNNGLFYGKFKESMKSGNMDVLMPYVFTYRLKPTMVRVHMYRDASSKTNWVFVMKK